MISSTSPGAQRQLTLSHRRWRDNFQSNLRLCISWRTRPTSFHGSIGGAGKVNAIEWPGGGRQRGGYLRCRQIFHSKTHHSFLLFDSFSLGEFRIGWNNPVCDLGVAEDAASQQSRLDLRKRKVLWVNRKLCIQRYIMQLDRLVAPIKIL